jgi:DNA-directed RNA polymerase specialized sigma24 family protein
MAHMPPDGETDGVDSMGFMPTQWSVVLAVAQADPARRAAALEQLCRCYWEPLYHYIRRQGYEMHDAQDLIQSFFAFVLEKNVIEAADPGRGRFRCFLLVCVKNFIATEHAKANAGKRDGGKIMVPLDAALAEKNYLLAHSSDHLTALQLFDRRWAETVVARALAQLSGEAVAAGKAEQLKALKPFLSVEGGDANYAAAAERLSMSLAAVRQEVHRMRRRLRELVRAEIAQTVHTPAEIDAEMRYLIELLKR